MSNIDNEDNEVKCRNQKHPLIHINNQELLKEEDTEKVDNLPKSDSLSNHYYYLATCILSVLMFSLCTWTSKVGFLEVVDLELPLVMLFTLILSSCIMHGYSKIAYAVYVLCSCVVYLFAPSYSFFIVTALTGNIVIQCLDKIYSNRSDYRNKTDTGSNNLFVEFLLRIRYYLLLSSALFIIFLVLGYCFPSVFQSVVLPSIEGMKEGIQQGTVKLETMSLFVNNFGVALNIIVGGLFFSTKTMYLLIFNALFVGFSACTMDLGHFLSFTLPHGIIELCAIIIAGAAGFRVSDAILTLISGIRICGDNNTDTFVEHTEICCKMLLDVVILVGIVAIMLLVAAYVEANLTIPIGEQLLRL